MRRPEFPCRDPLALTALVKNGRVCLGGRELRHLLEEELRVLA